MMLAVLLSNNSIFGLKLMRKRGQRSLYEVVGKAKLKPGASDPSSNCDSDLNEVSKPASTDKPAVNNLGNWPKKPRICQFNNGRIEFSIPYQLLVAVVLGVILLPLIAFRIGQSTDSQIEQKTGIKPLKVQKKEVYAGTAVVVPKKTQEVVIEKPKENVSAVKETEVDLSSKTGSNRIVILTCDKLRDTEPVKEFFKGFGIETETRKLTNGRYLLVSSKKYDNPAKIGSNG